MPACVHQEFRSAALAAPSGEVSWDLTCAYLSRFGFDGVLMAEQRGSALSIRSNIDAAWARYASDEQLKMDADPFFRHCFDSYDMLRTGADYLHLYPFLNRDDVAFIRAASETGLTAGVSVPARLPQDGGLAGWHLLSSHGHEAVRSVWNDDIADLRLSLLAVHHRLVGAGEVTDPRLSTRERDCLQRCAEGARTAAIADRLGISESTVEFHLRNARKKLSARTRDHAIAIAMRRGVIQ